MTAINTKNFENEDLSQWAITGPDKKLGASQCLSCARYRGERPVAGPCCQAYPGGIPSLIFDNKVKHDEHLSGDGGMFYVEDDEDLEVDLSLALAFDESKHPRDNEGQWAEKGGIATIDSSITFEPSYKDPDLEIDHDLIVKILAIQPGSKVIYSLTREGTGDFSDEEGEEDSEEMIENGNLTIEIINEKYHAYREIDFENKVIINQSLTVDKKYQKQGLGTKLLYEQVQAAKAAGFKRIETNAIKGKYFNGYYTWPKLGFDTKLDRVYFRGEWKLHWKAYGEKLSDVMQTQDGRDDWKANGDTADVAFDLNNKNSLAILTAARRAKKSDALALAWDESKHLRDPAGSDEGGEFTSGGGGGTKTKTKKAKKEKTNWNESEDGTIGEGDYAITYDFQNDDGYETDLSPEQVIRLVGAQPGAHVTYMWDTDDDEINGLRVEVSHPTYQAERFIYPPMNGGDGAIENVEINVKKASRKNGIGTKVLYDQVQAAKAMDFKQISTYAIRTPKHNGYYTWARLGFDAQLTDVDLPPSKFKQLAVFGENISDVIKTQEGRDLWLKHGDSVDMIFDLNNKKALAVLTAARRTKRPDALALAFDESLHPRDAEGTEKGGQFTSKGGSKTKTKTKTKKSKQPVPAPAPVKPMYGPGPMYELLKPDPLAEVRSKLPPEQFTQALINESRQRALAKAPTPDSIPPIQYTADRALDDDGEDVRDATTPPEPGMSNKITDWYEGESEQVKNSFEDWVSSPNDIQEAELKQTKAGLAWNAALDRAPVLTEGGDVWRGLSTLKEGMPDFDKWTKVGNEITLNTTQSASRSGAVADSFANGTILLRILEPKTAIDVSSMYDDGDSVDENEVLLRKGSKYRVVKVERNAEPFSGGRVDAFITLRQIS